MDAAGRHVDGPVMEGGEYFYVHLPKWGGGFDNDKALVMHQGSWDWAANMAEENGWLVMFIEGGSEHYLHFHDGYPLCWGLDQDGPFSGSFKEEEVDCAECLRFLNEGV